MIFYFSGSGNSKYIAQRIGEKTGGEVLHVSQNTPYALPDNKEDIGLVFPVYFWGIPKAAAEFLSALQIAGQHYIYLVLNCGGSTGDAAGVVAKFLRRKPDAVFSLLMPDTYVPMFDCSDAAKNQAVLDRAEADIEKLIEGILARRIGSFDKHRGLGKFYTATMYPLYKRTTTKGFKVTTDCVGCGTCVEVCHDDFVSLVEGKPVWKEGHCNLCLSCLHHCPQHAITYGKKSLSHGQYLCPGVK